MSAVACLRVLLDDNRTDLPADRLGPLVAKYSNIFLEVRWTFPRQFSQLSHYSYLLTDPAAQELDTVELAYLSQELQVRLFGTGAEDAVTLVLFEGDADAIAAFARYSVDKVLAAMRDPSDLPPGGRLRRIAPDGSLIDVPEAAQSAATAEAFRFGPTIDGAQGIYFSRGSVFIGDVLCCSPADAPSYFSMVEGDAHRPDDAEAFDAACVMTAVRFLVESSSASPVYVPISFSTLVRPGLREAWLDLAAVLPTSERLRLSATVYDVPRAPTYQALSTISASLEPMFTSIDLCVRDPDFQIEDLAPNTFSSVTLALAEARPDIRISALRRFASHSDKYRRRRIGAGLTNIRSHQERELAIKLRVPFLSGSGICTLQSELVGGRHWPVDSLPLLSANNAGVSRSHSLRPTQG